MKYRQIIKKSLIGLIIVITVVWSIFPLLYLLIVSFAGLGALPTSISLPKRLTLDNWYHIFFEEPIWPFMMNSIIVASITIIITLIVTLPAAYSFSRYRTNLNNVIFKSFLLFRMLPFIAIVIPIFFMMNEYGLLGTRLGLSLTHLIYTVPIGVWLLKGYFDMLSIEMEDAARVDGASRFQAFLFITLPLSRPGIAVVALFSFLYSYIEFPFAVILTRAETSTLPIHLARYYTIHETYWRQVACASLFSLIPMVLLFFALQKNLVRGFTLGAVK